ncbi:MAG: PspC domain-containing protein [Anaerolineaceae bacterium]|nr:PspC domain-containing protein [Anaerolineaceae bacterium]
MKRKLYRSQKDVIIAGICGGLAEYLNMDSTIVRIFFVLFAVGSGLGLLVYLILWFIVPRHDEPDQPAGNIFETGELERRSRQMGSEIGEVVRRNHDKTVKFIGFGLIVAGLFFLAQNLNLPWLRWINKDLMLPLLLIVGGAALLWRSTRGE